MVARRFAPLVLTLAVAACNSSVPPILEGASAAGGWASGCPQPADWPKSPEALSPEFDARLKQRFPPGTPAKELTAELGQWAFTISESCQDDPTIKMAHFRETEGRVLFMPMTASVYWKVDAGGRITWTKGFVAFAGL
jgi:hypothetical protein